MVGRLAGGLDALIGSIAVVKCAGLFLKSQGYQEAVSPAEESGLEQTEVQSLVAPYEIGPGIGDKVKSKSGARLSIESRSNAGTLSRSSEWCLRFPTLSTGLSTVKSLVLFLSIVQVVLPLGSIARDEIARVTFTF